MQNSEKNIAAASDFRTDQRGPAQNEPQRNETGFLGSLRFRYGLVLAGFLALGGYFLWQEHAAHIIGYLPLIAILGACIGMHFFMHGGHGGGHKDDTK